MDPLARLTAIEEIKQLKARYFWGYDHKDWAYWRDEVWAPDARLEVPEMNMTVEPRDVMIEWVAKQGLGQISVHHGHMPIIEVTSQTTATGIWAMEDRLYHSREHLLNGDTSFVIGFGHYHERYVRLDLGWRILSTRLTRLRTTYEKVL